LIAVDTNLLVYAHRQDSPFHAKAAQCLRTLSEGSTAWGLPWPCVNEFLAIVTHERIYAPPSRLDKALDQVAAWLESPSVVMLAESEGYWPVLAELLVRAKVTGPRVHDARIGALCIFHGVRELWTADRDFGRFAPLKTHNPLVAE
jgi:toxin-antitoxin system PIN domain toxin